MKSHLYPALLFFLCLNISCNGKSTSQPQDEETIVQEGSNILIVYLSRTNNTEAVAEMIQGFVGGEMVAIVGKTAWEVMNAKKALEIEWEEITDKNVVVQGWGGKQTVRIPAGLENTEQHRAKMAEASGKPGNILRRDGNPEAAFKNAARILKRTYTAPYLAHNCMEPVNCFANVTKDSAVIYGPTQAPEFIMQALSARLEMPRENIRIKLARMGGGFGQRAYRHHLVEAAAISQKVKAPIKMIYTREDDMAYGIYRPAYSATYRAALDENNNITALHVKAGDS